MNNIPSPGNWKAVPDDGTGTLPSVMSDKITDYGNFYVAVVQSTNFADARLMAAAKEMLDSLKGITRILEAFSYTTKLGKSQMDRLNAARALIAKIEGDTA